MAKLPVDRRRAFLLSQPRGPPYAETATVSDCPVGAIHSRVNRDRRTLTAQLLT